MKLDEIRDKLAQLDLLTKEISESLSDNTDNLTDTQRTLLYRLTDVELLITECQEEQEWI